MERQRHHVDSFVSIFSLMRDGRELAAALRSVRRPSGEQRAEELRRVVDPYVQFVTQDARCEFTGLRLQDIWRYFRHTWVNQYTSTPGRTMALLVRDRAAPFHPVVGIAALASPIVQIKERDTWIGWHPTAFFNNAFDNPSPQLGKWLRRIVTKALAEIYTEDLVAEAVISLAELRKPTPDTIGRLHTFATEGRKPGLQFIPASLVAKLKARIEAEGLGPDDKLLPMPSRHHEAFKFDDDREAAGIPKFVVGQGKAVFHSLRHTFGRICCLVWVIPNASSRTGSNWISQRHQSS